MNRWTVQFVGDYFTLQTSVEADDDEQAIEEAVTLLRDYYGWDFGSFNAEADAEYDMDEHV